MIIDVANRIKVVEEYYFSKKLKEIDELRKQGKDIINLGIGGPVMPPSKATIEKLKCEAEKSNTHTYQSYVGIEELRNGFSNWYKRWYNVDLNPKNEILPLIGSKEGIMHITMAFINKGDKVLVPNPGYPTYTSVSRLAEAEIINYDLDENNDWMPNFDKLEKQNLDGVKIMWLNYPNMPTGAKATKELFQKTIDFAKRHKILVVNDNPYSFILNNDMQSILSIDGAKDVALELNSLSKSHNMAGWRIGMVGGNSDYINAILKVKSNMDSGMFKPMQMAAAEALSSGQDWYDSINKVYRENKIYASQIMDAIGCKYSTDTAGLFIWGKIDSKYSRAEELSDKLLYEADVFITPGHIFGSNGEKYLRIALCGTTDMFQKALERVMSVEL